MGTHIRGTVRFHIEARRKVVRCYRINGVWYKFTKWGDGEETVSVYVKVNGKWAWKRMAEFFDFKWDEVTQVLELEDFNRLIRG